MSIPAYTPKTRQCTLRAVLFIIKNRTGFNELMACPFTFGDYLLHTATTSESTKPPGCQNQLSRQSQMLCRGIHFLRIRSNWLSYDKWIARRSSDTLSSIKAVSRTVRLITTLVTFQATALRNLDQELHAHGRALVRPGRTHWLECGSSPRCHSHVPSVQCQPRHSPQIHR